MGDSKTASNSFNWQNQLLTNLRLVEPLVINAPLQLAGDGWTVTNLDLSATAWLAAAHNAPTWILINIGINDVLLGTSQATFETRLGSVLDKIHAKWASTKVLVMLPWARNKDAACNTMDDVWIPNALSPRSSFAFTGPDERVYLKGADNGVTLTSDGIHPNAAGNTATAAVWQSAMGY